MVTPRLSIISLIVIVISGLILMISDPSRVRAEPNTDLSDFYRQVYADLNAIAVHAQVVVDGREEYLSQRLQTDTELRLRRAGIAVIPVEKAYKGLRQPVLHVCVNGRTTQTGNLIAYAIDVQLTHRAILAGTSIDAAAMVWTRSCVAASALEAFPDRARRAAGDFVDDFVNAYLASRQKHIEQE